MPTLGASTPPQALLEFCKQLNSDINLQARVKSVENPQQIIDIASSLGKHFSVMELRVWSRELVADYFPWATLGNKWRRNFFDQKSISDNL
jgi:hypothetical protein